jgi:hypothetical protein
VIPVVTKKELLDENEDLRSALSDIRDRIDDLLEEEEGYQDEEAE